MTKNKYFKLLMSTFLLANLSVQAANLTITKAKGEIPKVLDSKDLVVTFYPKGNGFDPISFDLPNDKTVIAIPKVKNISYISVTPRNCLAGRTYSQNHKICEYYTIYPVQTWKNSFPENTDVALTLNYGQIGGVGKKQLHLVVPK